MTDICQRQFRFQKFRLGPVCPNPRCPGASCDGKVLPLDSSSDESDGETEGNSTCDEADDCCARGEARRHVICIDPAVSSRPLWCNSTPVHEFEEVKQWLVKVINLGILCFFVCFLFEGIRRKVANLMPQIKLISYNHKSRRTGDIHLLYLVK